MKNPAFFQGSKRKRRYFEGWYFKCISADRKHAIAFIPGMAVDANGKKHAFIQLIDAVAGKTWYFHFPYDDFKSRTDDFSIQIGPNRFDSQGLTIDIDQPDGRVKGQLQFSGAHLFPYHWYNPGIMGPFSFFPWMECYHAIIHLDHQIQGVIELNGEILDLTGGAGYIEKDFGRSFPRTYLWLQASHFDNGNASFVFSRARIPFLGSEFPGFFAYFTDLKGLAVRFATYNRSHLSNWQVDPEQRTCSGELTGPAGTLVFSARMAGGGRLRAPVDGLMDREIIESITALVSVRLTSPTGQLLYEGTSGESGMEICMAVHRPTI